MKIFHTTMAVCGLLTTPILQGATVSIMAEGLISQSADEGEDFALPGDRFRVSISYRSDLEDSDPTSFFGQYFDDDLRVVFEFLGTGRSLEGTGGSVNVTTILGPDGVTYVPEILILSGLPELGAFLFGFRDEDGSEITQTELPTSFSDVEEYDFVGFSVIDLSLRVGGTRPIPPLLEGGVSFVSVPEPSSLLLLSFGISILFRRFR